MDRKTFAERIDLKRLKMVNYSISGTKRRKLRISELYRQSVMPPIVKTRKREI